MGHGRNTQSGPLSLAVAAILHSAFLELLITQSAFARSLNIPASTLSDYFRGVRVIDLEMFVVLCAALGLDPGNVLEVAAQVSS